jgi:tetratricopeptide (TPR) repeat protein
MNDPYSVLEISQNASTEEVKRAYRDLARKYHPDNYQNNPLADLAEAKMKEINEAYDVIMKMREGGGNGRSRSGGGSSSYQSGYGSTPLYAQIRSAINAGNLGLAEQLLGQAPVQDAEWHFLSGSVAYRKGWLDEARQQYQIAYNMAPNNPEYQQALQFMQGGGQAYRPYGYGGMQGANPLDCCTALICADCLCGHGC